MKNILTLSLAFAIAVATTACAKNLGNATYLDNSTVGIVYEGVILSSRPVTIKSDKSDGDQMGLGTLGGGALGGVAGSNIGKGKGSSAGAVGGAIAGAVLGHIIEDQLNTQQGFEYIVKLNDDSLSEEGDESTTNYNKDESSVSSKLRNSTKIGLKSRAISVVQADAQPFTPGQQVYVIYNDDRPRITPKF
jgi:outer membrane lipoprotein SlyB